MESDTGKIERLTSEQMKDYIRKKVKRQEFLKPHQLAKEYNFPFGTIMTAIHDKKIEHFKIDSTKGGYRIRRKVFEKFMEQFEVKIN